MKPSVKPAAEATDDRRAYRDGIPYLLAAIGNMLSASGARLYRKRFGIGLTEGRLMWVLGHESPVTAATASQIMGTDKAAVSRALAGLVRRGLVRVSSNPADARERTIELSPDGCKLYEQISAASKLRQRRLLSIYSAEERALLADLLGRLLDHIPCVDTDDWDERGRVAHWAVGPETL
ncbi:MAG TPA: MarR family transcriptional regulator [Rhodopila sp.]|nr:MarR family transcriptional regulator [Rhodopila sp.]